MNVPQNNYPPQGAPFPPGWYQDPWNPAALRWWDGMQWTHITDAVCQCWQRRMRYQEQDLSTSTQGQEVTNHSKDEAAVEDVVLSASTQQQGENERVSGNANDALSDQIRFMSYIEGSERFRPEGYVAFPSPAAKVARGIFGAVGLILVGSAMMTGTIYLLIIFPLLFTPFADFGIGGLSAEAIAPYFTIASVLTTAVACIVGVPFISIAEKVEKREDAAELSARYEGEFFAEEMSFKGYASNCARVNLFMRESNSALTARMGGWFVGGLIGFMLHDPLMSTIGNPWADVLTIVGTLLLSGILEAVFHSAAMGKYRGESSR